MFEGAVNHTIKKLSQWVPLMDSSNIEIDGILFPLCFITGCERVGLDWIRIATEIELNYATFDAFVILHGTDTMAYTASALSFMLEDLGKTVVGFICRFTGPLLLPV